MSTNYPSIQLTSVRVDPAAGPVIQPWRIDFVYDGLRRMRRALTYTWNSGSSSWTSVGETRYLYDGMLIVQERSSGNTPQVHYTRGLDLSGTIHGAGGIGGLLMRSHGYSAGSWSSHNGYHSDANGNVTALVNSSGSLQANYKYDPYGGTLSSSGTLATANVMRFSSKPSIFSSTGGWGMYYYGYRFYDPATQRWLNRDPIAEEGGLNVYTFAANSSLNKVDPVGNVAAVDDTTVLLVVCTAGALAICTVYVVVSRPPPDIQYPRWRLTENCHPQSITLPMQGRRETGVRTTDGGTKADAKADGIRGSTLSGDEKKSKENEVEPVIRPDPLRGIREHFSPDMPPKDGAPPPLRSNRRVIYA